MTVRIEAEVEELCRMAAATPAHAHFGIRSLVAVPGELPTVHDMTVGPELLDSTEDELDLGVLALVADPSCAAAAANLCPSGVVPVTRSLRLERIRALCRGELPGRVTATAEPAWDAGDHALIARAVVRSDQLGPLALVTFLGLAVSVPNARPAARHSQPESGRAPFRVEALTRGGLPWRAEVWAGAACANLGGQVHGGIATLLASRIASRVHRAEEVGPLTPLDLSVEFLRPLPIGAAITAVAGVARSSRRFSRVEGAFYVSDRVALRFVSTAIRAGETVT
jgi:acyl-coenzyme A thioesterase PaaI-like protein